MRSQEAPRRVQEDPEQTLRLRKYLGDRDPPENWELRGQAFYDITKCHSRHGTLWFLLFQPGVLVCTVSPEKLNIPIIIQITASMQTLWPHWRTFLNLLCLFNVNSGNSWKTFHLAGAAGPFFKTPWSLNLDPCALEVKAFVYNMLQADDSRCRKGRLQQAWPPTPESEIKPVCYTSIHEQRVILWAGCCFAPPTGHSTAAV